MSSTDLYRQAIEALEKSPVLIDPAFPVSDRDVQEVETRLGHRLPASYAAMLKEYGRLGFGPHEIYGIGRQGLDGTSKQNILVNAAEERAAGRLSDTMITIMQSGYGPYFVLDCGETDADGEAPVYELTLAGQEGDKTKVADSFGAFLLNEVTSVVERAERRK